MRPKFNEVKLWDDKTHITHSIVMDKEDPHINFTLNVLQELHDVDLHTEVRLTQKADPSYFFTSNSSVNLCRILNFRNQSPVGNLLHAYLKEYGHMIEHCPIVKVNILEIF